MKARQIEFPDELDICLVRKSSISQRWLQVVWLSTERIGVLSTEVRKIANNCLDAKFNELFPVMISNTVLYPTFS